MRLGQYLANSACFVRQASEQGAQSTSAMVARAGRSSYVNVDRLNCVDPGALAVSIWLRAAFKGLKNEQ